VALSATEQLLVPVGGTKLAVLGVAGSADFESCAQAPVADVAFPLRALPPGSVLCVETPLQRMAVVTVTPVAGGRQLDLDYDLFRHKSAG
jgi:hypothetical protein